jgi:hypothetical protein
MHVDAFDPVVTSVDAGFDPLRPAAAQAAPNPFHSATEIELRFPRSGRLDLVIYDIRGRTDRYPGARAPITVGAGSRS